MSSLGPITSDRQKSCFIAGAGGAAVQHSWPPMAVRDPHEDASEGGATPALPRKKTDPPGPAKRAREPAGTRKHGISIVLKLTGLVALVLLPVELVLLAAGHHYWREMVKTETRAHLSGLATNRAELVQAQIQL